MQATFHILNGDALARIFPKSIQGAHIIMRECLIEGTLEGENLTAFYANRARYIATTFDGATSLKYYDNSVTEFEKIRTLPENSIVYLWFEEDVFCQTNLWFVGYLLSQNIHSKQVYLVLPKASHPYSFGYHTEAELEFQFNCSKQILSLTLFEKLWKAYQKGDTSKLLKIATQHQSDYPFILKAVQAYQASIPSGNDMGRPTDTLLQIMKELKTDDFATIFNEFCKREAIYGYGDVQVKKLIEAIKK